jgi:hypothetical protein
LNERFSGKLRKWTPSSWSTTEWWKHNQWAQWYKKNSQWGNHELSHGDTHGEATGDG